MGKSIRPKKSKPRVNANNDGKKGPSSKRDVKLSLKASTPSANSSNTKNGKKSKMAKSAPKYAFANGEEIDGVNTFKVVSQIGRTTRPLSCDYYIVKETETEEESVMKTSILDIFMLKKEAYILKKLSKKNITNFLKLVEYGSVIKKGIEYIVVAPFGVSLYTITSKVLDSALTYDCGINVATQMLRAISDLHSIGYIHRNISPHVFNCGVKDRESTVILVEFRIQKQYLDNKKHVAAKPRVKRLRNMRFGSRSTNLEHDQSRRDDLESWLYTIFYLMDRHSLSWAKETDDAKIAKEKEEFMKNDCSVMYKKVKTDLKPVVTMIKALTFDATPEYSKILDILKKSAPHASSKCDWKGKTSAPKELEGDTKHTGDNRLTGEFDCVEGTQRTTAGKKKKKPPRKKLSSNDCIRHENNKSGWQVVNLLGSGGFGDVYKVFKEGGSPDKCYALKTESELGEKRYLRLKVEVTVMMKTNDKSKSFEHFIEFVDRGKCEELKCKFVVMGLVGPSIDDIRKKYILNSFTKHTLFNVYIQTVQAVQDLHSLGYLHRDIKPANYAVGLNDCESVVYMLDFGIAKLYIDADGAHKTPRKKVKFLGTLRYASRACMKCVEQGRKDDLECWMYMVIDLGDEFYGIPWRSIADPKAILKSKDAFFENDYPEVWSRIPKSLYTLVQYIDKLGYESTPDYEYIITFLRTCAKDNGIKPDKKLDWIGKLKKKAIEDSESEKSDTKHSGEDED